MLALARRLALASLLLAACSGDDDRDGREQEESAATGDGDAEPSDNPAEVCGKGKEAFVKGLSLRDFAIYQAVKIDVIKDRVWAVDRAAPIVQGKKALVRVFVTAQEGWQPHRVNGVLTLDNGSGPKYLVDDFRPEGDSKDTDAASTLNFDVDAADIGPNTQFSISITEQECSDELGTAAAVRFPTKGMQALGAEHIGKLRVVVVPVKVNGITPDMSDDHLAKMRDLMLAMYPVPDVEVSWREPLDWPYEVQAFGEGWTDLLNEIGSVRNQDDVDDDVYYYGVMTPESDFYTFCGRGCVLGLAPQAVWRSPDQQIGLGIGFVNNETYTTMAHEVGHAHGRGHAPCGGARGVDPSFPNETADIGVWGWDSRTGALKLPSDKDIMGYCSPVWISAYTYNALAERCADVNTQFRIAPSPRAWVGMVLYDDASSPRARGTARWSRTRTLRMPGGDAEPAIVKDAFGNTLGEVEVVRVRLSHSDDAFLYVPEPQANWATLVLGDRELSLRSVQSPL